MTAYDGQIWGSGGGWFPNNEIQWQKTIYSVQVKVLGRERENRETGERMRVLFYPVSQKRIICLTFHMGICPGWDIRLDDLRGVSPNSRVLGM